MPRPSQNSLIHQNRNPFGWFFDRKIVIPPIFREPTHRLQGIRVKVRSNTTRDSKTQRMFRLYFEQKLSFSRFLFFLLFSVLVFFFFYIFFSFSRSVGTDDDWNKIRRSRWNRNSPFVAENRRNNVDVRVVCDEFCVFAFRCHFPTVFPWGTWPIFPICLYLFRNISDPTAFQHFYAVVHSVCFFLPFRIGRYTEFATVIYVNVWF